MVVTVAPAGYTGQADYYCDGANDQILINAAIQYVSSAYGGGTVRLLEGTFNVVPQAQIGLTYYTAIVLKSNIQLEGSGVGTVISATCATNPISNYSLVICSEGDIAAFYTNIHVADLAITIAYRESATVWPCGIVMYYTNTMIINNVSISGDFQNGIFTIGSVSNCRIINNTIDGELETNWQQPIIITGQGTQIIGNTVLRIRSSSTVYGFSIQGDRNIVSNNIVEDISSSGGASDAYGVYVSSDYCTISGNQITTVKNSTTAALAYGIYLLAGATSDAVSSNYCYNNGSDTGIANTNGNNFLDGGTDTQVYSNSWQSPVAGEPSLGTPHPHIYNWADLGAAAIGTYTFTVPAAVLAAKPTVVWVWLEQRNQGVNGKCSIQDMTGNQYASAIGAVLNTWATCACPVPVDSSGQFHVVISTAAVFACLVGMDFYWV